MQEICSIKKRKMLYLIALVCVVEECHVVTLFNCIQFHLIDYFIPIASWPHATTAAYNLAIIHSTLLIQSCQVSLTTLQYFDGWKSITLSRIFFLLHKCNRINHFIIGACTCICAEFNHSDDHLYQVEGFWHSLTVIVHKHPPVFSIS